MTEGDGIHEVDEEDEVPMLDLTAAGQQSVALAAASSQQSPAHWPSTPVESSRAVVMRAPQTTTTGTTPHSSGLLSFCVMPHDRPFQSPHPKDRKFGTYVVIMKMRPSYARCQGAGLSPSGCGLRIVVDSDQDDGNTEACKSPCGCANSCDRLTCSVPDAGPCSIKLHDHQPTNNHLEAEMDDDTGKVEIKTVRFAAKEDLLGNEQKSNERMKGAVPKAEAGDGDGDEAKKAKSVKQRKMRSRRRKWVAKGERRSSDNSTDESLVNEGCVNKEGQKQKRGQKVCRKCGTASKRRVRGLQRIHCCGCKCKVRSTQRKSTGDLGYHPECILGQELWDDLVTGKEEEYPYIEGEELNEAENRLRGGWGHLEEREELISGVTDEEGFLGGRGLEDGEAKADERTGKVNGSGWLVVMVWQYPVAPEYRPHCYLRSGAFLCLEFSACRSSASVVQSSMLR